MLGLSTRKQAKFFKNFIGDCISCTTVSTILKKIAYLAYLVIIYRNRPLRDDYEYLYLGVMWIHIKELNLKNRPILVALGVKRAKSISYLLD